MTAMEDTRREQLYLLGEMAHGMLSNLHAAQGFVSVLKGDVFLHEIGDYRRCALFEKMERELAVLGRKAGMLFDLSYFASKEELPRDDKVLVNQLCRQTADECEARVAYRSDIPDYYAVRTNGEALKKLIELLLNEASERIKTSDDSREGVLKGSCEDEPRIFLIVTEQDERGRLTFSVTARTGGKVYSGSAPQVPHLLCQMLARLLGGFAYIDPDYRDGVRVIFDIDIIQH